MRRSTLMAAIILSSLFPGAAFAFQAKPPVTAAGRTVSFTGTVSGAPAGKTFTLSITKGTYTVDASKARIRDHGKFAKIDVIKPGAKVTVVGTLSGSSLTATSVTTNSAAKKGTEKLKGGGMIAKMKALKDKMSSKKSGAN